MFRIIASFYNIVQWIPKSWSTVSNGTVRKTFLCFIYAIIVGISCRVVVGLNMFSKVSWKCFRKFVYLMFVHESTKIKLIVGDPRPILERVPLTSSYTRGTNFIWWTNMLERRHKLSASHRLLRKKDIAYNVTPCYNRLYVN